MYKKNNGRTTYKSHRRPSFKKMGGHQGFKGRNRGNVSHQYNKYLKLAREYFRSGDRVQSEYYYQFTDHYYRLMVELGINIEENTQNEEIKEDSSNDENLDKDNQNQDPIETDINNSNEESIEAIPFIAKPTKDKRTKSTK